MARKSKKKGLDNGNMEEIDRQINEVLKSTEIKPSKLQALKLAIHWEAVKRKIEDDDEGSFFNDEEPVSAEQE